MSNEDISNVISRAKANLKSFMEAKGISQKDLVELWEVAKSTVSNYLNPDNINFPNIEQLYVLKVKYGISMEDLVSIHFNTDKTFLIDGTSITEYDKFTGVYMLYYISTDKINTSPKITRDAKLSYGILALEKLDNGVQSVTKDSYRAYACFTIKTEEEASIIKEEAEQAYNKRDYHSLADYFRSRKRYCEGQFELIQNGCYYTYDLQCFSVNNNNPIKTTDGISYPKTITDRILLTGYNPDQTNASPYIGGTMLSSSLSRGRRKIPCSQIIFSSRQTLLGEEQEIMERLQSLYLDFDTSKVAKSITTKVFDLQKQNYPIEIQELTMESFITKEINNELQRSNSRLFYLQDNADQEFYDFLKGMKE